jgi:hypothetical protein
MLPIPCDGKWCKDVGADSHCLGDCVGWEVEIGLRRAALPLFISYMIYMNMCYEFGRLDRKPQHFWSLHPMLGRGVQAEHREHVSSSGFPTMHDQDGYASMF